jgi:hypothetical protein
LERCVIVFSPSGTCKAIINRYHRMNCKRNNVSEFLIFEYSCSSMHFFMCETEGKRSAHSIAILVCLLGSSLLNFQLMYGNFLVFHINSMGQMRKDF